METGILYIVATPIGNLGDITLRALETLKAVDMIAAEDTRRTIKLLNHYEIKNKLISYHEHSKLEKEETLIENLKQGKSIALVSDAGTPLISDPGFGLVNRATDEGIKVVPIPGVSAVITAISVSGMVSGGFRFEGFLPAKTSERNERLSVLSTIDLPCVFYEAPHRITSTLKAIVKIYGREREVVIARELTKIHETFMRGQAGTLLTEIEATPLKGEIVLIVDGKTQQRKEATDEEIVASLKELIKNGATKKDAVVKTASTLFTCKNRVYQISLKL